MRRRQGVTKDEVYGEVGDTWTFGTIGGREEILPPCPT